MHVVFLGNGGVERNVIGAVGLVWVLAAAGGLDG